MVTDIHLERQTLGCLYGSNLFKKAACYILLKVLKILSAIMRFLMVSKRFLPKITEKIKNIDSQTLLSKYILLIIYKFLLFFEIEN